MEFEVFGRHSRGLRRVIPWPRPEEVAAESQPEAPSPVVSVAEAMTVHETRFFRDVLPFELLRTRLLPQLLRARGDERRLRLWSAGCSTGEEAWSLAMLLDEVAGEGWRTEVLGTDLSARVLETARRGVYRREELTPGMSLAMRRRFFTPEGERWRVAARLRGGVSFRQHDQREPLAGEGARFDVILLRNVLLYLTPPERARALREAHRMLAPDGVLLLGVLEQAEESSELFHAELDEECYFYRPVTAGHEACGQPSERWPRPRIQ